MNKITYCILIILFILNIYFSFVYDSSNLVRIGNWILPYAIFAVFLYFVRKVKKYDKILCDTDKRLKNVRRWVK